MQRVVLSLFVLMAALTTVDVQPDEQPPYDPGDSGPQTCGSYGKWEMKLPSMQHPFTLRWAYRQDVDELDFIFTVNTGADGDGWIAVGFNDLKPDLMIGADIITGEFNSGAGTITDRFATDKSAPAADTTQDLTDASIRRDGTVVTVKFTRKRNTGDSKDFVITDTNQPYVIVAFGHGSGFNAPGRANKGSSATKVCLGSAYTTPVPPPPAPHDCVCEPRCPMGWVAMRNRCFLGQSCRYKSCSANDARMRCAYMGAKLARVLTAEDGQFFVSNVFGFYGKNMFVDGRDEGTEGAWVYDDGTAIAFSVFHPGSSSSSQKTEKKNCVFVTTNPDDVYLFPIRCDKRKTGAVWGFVCEK